MKPLNLNKDQKKRLHPLVGMVASFVCFHSPHLAIKQMLIFHYDDTYDSK